MRGLQLLALVVLLSARANARVHSQPSEHKHPQDHPYNQHVKHLVLDYPLEQTRLDHYPLRYHKQPSEDRVHLEELNPSRDNHTSRVHGLFTAAVTSVPDSDMHLVRSSEDLNSLNRQHFSPVHRAPDRSDSYYNVEPKSPSRVLQIVNHLEDLGNPSHHHNQDHNYPPVNSNHAKTARAPWEDVNLTSEDVQPSKDNNLTSHVEVANRPYHHHRKSVDLTQLVKGHGYLQDLYVTVEDVNSNGVYKHPKNLSPSEDVNLTSEDQIHKGGLRSQIPIQAKAGKDYPKDLILTLEEKKATYEESTHEDATNERSETEEESDTYEEQNLTSEDERATYEKQKFTSEEESATYEDQNLTPEDERAAYEERNVTSEDERATYEERKFTSEDESVSYEERNLTSADEKATYEERNFTSEDERATIEERNLTSEDERATNEERNISSEDKRATYEERNLNTEDERATYEERNFTSEDERPTYDERNLTSKDERATYEERNFTSEDQRATYEERNLTSKNDSATYKKRNFRPGDKRATHKNRNLTSEKVRSRAHHSRVDNRNRKSQHFQPSLRQAPKKTLHPKHFYSTSRVYPKFARQLSQILRPFFHIQETSDERPFDLTRERLVHNGNSVEILPLHPTPVNKDKAPLALILGGPKRDKGRKKYFYSKKHKNGHVKASIEILDESDERPGNDTDNVAVTSEVGNFDSGVINLNDEEVNRIVELKYELENDPVVAFLNDIQSQTIFGPENDGSDLREGNENENQIDNGSIFALPENVLESNDNDFLPEESNSNRYSSLDSSISEFSDTLLGSSSDSLDFSNVSVYPRVYTLSGEKMQLVNDEFETESNISTDYTIEENYKDGQHEGTDVSVIDERSYSTSEGDKGNDNSGIKEEFVRNDGENKNGVLDDFDILTFENDLKDDYSLRDSSKSGENRDENDTTLNEKYIEEMLNEELTREDNKNRAVVDEIINRNVAEEVTVEELTAEELPTDELLAEVNENHDITNEILARNNEIVTNELRNAVSDLNGDNFEEIELKVKKDDDKCRRYVLQFQLPAHRKSDYTRVKFLEELRTLLEKHRQPQKSYNLSFLFQK